jgi:replicative DNA helicase
MGSHKKYVDYDTQTIPHRKALNESWARFSFNRTRDWGLYGIDIGIHPFNMALGGWIPKRLTTIGARSGTGKTALTAPILSAALRSLTAPDRRPEFLFFTWELDPTILCDRLICARTGLTLAMLNMGAKLLTDSQYNNVKAAYQEISKYPVTYQPHTTNIEIIRDMVVEFVGRCNTLSSIEGRLVQPVVMIDYINMAQFENAQSRTYGILDFMTGLKVLCNEYNVCGLVFAQILRETDKQNRIPDRQDFKDSASIEDASDNLLVLYRPEHHHVATIMDPDIGVEVDAAGKMLVRVLKGRDYGTGDFLINCDIKHFRFWDKNHTFDYEYWHLYNDETFWKQTFLL